MSDAQKKTIIKLRIQFIHKNINRRWFVFKKFPFLIQNEPFEYGIRVKNIGTEAFSGATITQFSIHHLALNIGQNATNMPKIHHLNPNEEVELFIDCYTLWHEGSIGTRCTISPENNNEEIQTFQHHKAHNFDEPYPIKNNWWHDYYCQSQQQLLQTRTNNLILILTGITVLEAIFGLKEILQWIANILALALGKIASILYSLGSG